MSAQSSKRAAAASVSAVASETTAAKSGATVTIICKIPQGFALQLYKKQTVSEVTQNGHRDVERHYPIEGKVVYIRGPAHAQNEGPRCRMAGGYAITENVSKDHWDEWMRQVGKDHPAVQNGLIQAFPDARSAVDEAKKFIGLKTGLERIDPNNLPVTDQRFTLNTADEQVAPIEQHAEE